MQERESRLGPRRAHAVRGWLHGYLGVIGLHYRASRPARILINCALSYSKVHDTDIS